MAKAIDFAVRDSVGGVARGSVAANASSNFVQMGIGDEISLNLARASIAGYSRSGNDLTITLIDGRQIVLSGYFNPVGEPNQLYLSQDGEVIAVEFSNAANGNLVATYGGADGWDKFSTLDDLRHAGRDDLAMVQSVNDEPSGMGLFVPGLIGAGGIGAAVIGTGIVGGLIGGGGGDGDTGPRPPTVNEPDSSSSISTKTEDKELEVSGTGEPGDKVTVVVGDKTETTTVDEDGNWSVVFPEDGLPADGTHKTEVEFEHSDGSKTELPGPEFIIDLTPPDVEITDGAKSTGHVENAVDYTDGVKISGTGEAGATVVVEINGHSHTTTITESGTWTVTFPTTQIETGEYETAIKVTATDSFGNETVITDTLVVDTIPHPITFDSVTTDNTVNGSESGAGFSITGTSTAGASLTVTVQGVTQTVTVGADGKWTVTYPAGALPAGQYDATVTATTTDAAGNVSNVSHVFRVDTQVTPFAKTGDSTGTDNVLNHTESLSGLTVTGVVEPGSTVTVQLAGGAVVAAVVAADGSWSAVIPAGQIPQGESTAALVIRATDHVGNTAVLNETIQIDTVVDPLTQTGNIAGNNVVNAANVAAGISISGTVEAGSTVIVKLSTGQSVTATVDASGNWTAVFSSADLPRGEDAITYTVTATDIVGNTRIIGDDGSLGFTLDTVAPSAPLIINDLGTGNQLNGIQVTQAEGDLTFFAIGGSGVATQINASVVDLAGGGNLATFNGTSVPDGSYLVIRDEDAAGNESSTLYVRNTSGSTTTIDLSLDALKDFDFGTIDLSSASGKLTLTSADLAVLTGPEQELIIRGADDDQVELKASEAVLTGETTSIQGQTYDVYSLGGHRLLVDDDITVTYI
ncbi:Ig-like domain-containing protein [Pseudogemmobacter sonorensis]|uniref:Ig-like domain-containing protein n=1 Tax=Pseudogemmobacter sonorensis TaxID=2989681 RepID=UPI003693EDE0